MRVTNHMMINNLQENIRKNLKQLDKYNNQLSTGKKFNLPSENPSATRKGMVLKSSLESVEQYKKNINHAQDHLLNTEQVLTNVTEILQSANEKAIQGANETLSQSDRIALADDIDQLNEYLLQLSNTKIAGNYIFSGYKNQTKPFDNVTDNYQGDFNKLETEIAPGITLDYNVPGNSIFGANGELFDIFSDLSANLRADNTTGIDEGIEKLNNEIDDVMAILSEIGSKTNRLELSSNRLNDQEINLTKIISGNEDADIAQVITDLKMQENMFQATLATGARIIQPTLMDFLR
ncbi:MAG: flagellar hook-associated protein FlgL [bacterium]